MQGKYRNIAVHCAAWLLREFTRGRLARLVRWSPLIEPEPGCTAIIGMCSRLPYALDANLRCLYAARWPELRRVVIVIDATRVTFPHVDEQRLRAIYPEFGIDVLHYSSKQAGVAERLKLPFVYAWLSWCIALANVRTRHLLIHDYDALVFGATLADRYKEFVHSNAKVQGVSWYQANGINPEDKLATTFEAIADTAWLRSLTPVSLFNKIGIKDGRSVDYDITLYAQDRRLTPEQRTCVPMSLEGLVHPSQMIHQYTMFRRNPGKPLPSFSMPMLPFFSYLAGNAHALARAAASLREAALDAIDLAGDGTPMNLAQLGTAQVDWLLKQMVQASMALGMLPDRGLYEYGTALYEHVRASAELHWRGDFTGTQREWIARARLGD